MAFLRHFLDLPSEVSLFRKSVGHVFAKLARRFIFASWYGSRDALNREQVWQLRTYRLVVWLILGK